MHAPKRVLSLEMHVFFMHFEYLNALIGMLINALGFIVHALDIGTDRH